MHSSSPKKILAIKLRSLGDTVLMTAPLAALGELFPEAKIHVVVRTPWAPLLLNHPNVHDIWPLEPHADKVSRAKAIARLALKLRKEKYDLVVTFHASPSSATLAFATGAEVRSIHFHGHKDKNRYSTVVVPGKGVVKPNIERDMDAVRALVPNQKIPEGRMPTLFLKPGEMNEAYRKLTDMKLPRPILALGLGASRPTKSWPVERFAELASGWIQATRGGVVLLTGPGEEALGLKIFELLGENRSQVGSLSSAPIRELAAVLSQCSVFAGNDSGPKHVAVAVQTPTVTIFGPEHPLEWHPYPRDKHPYFFIESLTCRKDAAPGMPPWCAIQHCTVEQHRCMKEIKTEQVLSECQRVMKR